MLQYPFIRLAPLSRMDDEMGSAAATLARRIEGRLFTDDGRLYFVLSVDPESGFAQVSHRADGRLQVTQMPISEVAVRISCDGEEA